MPAVAARAPAGAAAFPVIRSFLTLTCDANRVNSLAIVTTASRRQRHRSHEARRLSDGRVDAIDATARRVLVRYRHAIEQTFDFCTV